MNDLRARLRASDPVQRIRPLDPAEQAAMRVSMRAVRRDAPWKLGWKLAALALASGAAFTLAVWWTSTAPEPRIPAAVVTVPPAPVATPPAPAPPVTAQAQAHPRPHAQRPIARTAVRQVRFVTANGTQILWTFRSTSEGA